MVARSASVALVATLLALPAPAAAGDISGRRAKALVARIAALGPRPAGSLNERIAGRLVADRFRTLGYLVRYQRFRLPNGRYSRNVLGRSRGAGAVRAVIVAHLDGVSEGPAANDNASGVATTLEVAAALQGREGLLFATLGAEERVETGSRLHLGSARLVRSLPKSVRRRIRLALSLDMVGVGSTLNVRGLEERPNRSARHALARARALGFRASYLEDSGVSDHAELTRGGVPAALVTWRWDPCWHSACDRASRVSARKMVSVARLAAASARAVLSARYRTPTVTIVQGNGVRTSATSPAAAAKRRKPASDQWLTWPGVFPSART